MASKGMAGSEGREECRGNRWDGRPNLTGRKAKRERDGERQNEREATGREESMEVI